jgi:hypothetical protein
MTFPNDCWQMTVWEGLNWSQGGYILLWVFGFICARKQLIINILSKCLLLNSLQIKWTDKSNVWFTELMYFLRGARISFSFLFCVQWSFCNSLFCFVYCIWYGEPIVEHVPSQTVCFDFINAIMSLVESDHLLIVRIIICEKTGMEWRAK